MTEETILETLKVQPLDEDEKKSRHILRRLMGPIASCKEGTRNGRKYNRELWEKALNDEIFQEKIKTKSLFLELGHPDREETDMSCACACIPEMPKIIGDDLYAVVDVLDTPAGGLLNTLIDYGFQPGISSRGTGDIIDGYDGESEVDPNTFFLETWDIVQTPALKKARLSVMESLETQKKGLREALTESLNSSSEENRKMMQEALHNVGIDIIDEQKESTPDKGADIEEKTPEDDEGKDAKAEDNGSDELIRGLQEALKEKAELETTVRSLQERLAVSDAKARKLEDENGKCKSTIVRLTNLVRESKERAQKVEKLEEQLESKNKGIALLDRVVNESKTKMQGENDSLRESLNRAKADVASLRRELKEARESSESEISALRESLETQKGKSSKEIVELKTRLQKSSKLAEGYKRLANDTVDRYISSKAVMLGVSPNEIKNKLNESYTIDDVDEICEGLRTYSLNLSKLPFKVGKNASISIKESKTPERKANPNLYDDDIDESSMRIAGLL